MAPPPPPPPPPPMCFPFSSNKPRFRGASPLIRSDSEKSETTSHKSDIRSHRSHRSESLLSNRSRQSNRLVRSGSYSTTRTLSDPEKEKLEFDTDSEVYDVPTLPNNNSKLSQLPPLPLIIPEGNKSNLVRSDSRKSTKWGYGWGVGRVKEKERDLLERSPSVGSDRSPPKYNSPTRTSSRSSGSKRPALFSNDSSSTLVGSALERKMGEVASIRDRVDTSDRLEQIRKLMVKDGLDY